ncbi:MAG: response regulator [Gammaproteobacteria bacterium]|nr:MAG: response regulator [Gammaproteobacteria bacterium]
MPDKYRIMVVDDEDTTRMLIAAILSKYGFSVIEESDGAKCIERAVEEQPDVLLLDIMMDDVNGFDICEQIRNTAEICALPVIFITGLDARFGILKALRVGATDYIIKPIEPEDVIAKVNSILTTKNLIKDKLNLLKINQIMISKVNDTLSGLGIIKKMEDIKVDIASDSHTVLDYIAEARKCIDEYNEDAALTALARAEMALQFSDRVSQQLNEFAKVLAKITDIMESPESHDTSDGLYKASTDSVLQEKSSQEDVDKLLDSL